MPARQLTFDLDVREARGREDFLVSSCNADAAAWIDRWPDWPEPLRGLALVGATGSGKSHLGDVWRSQSGAERFVGGQFSALSIRERMGQASSAVIDISEEIGHEEALLHLYNIVAERGGSVLILSRIAPTRLPLRLPDLASRLATLPVALLREPDDALLAGVLAKHFADRQLNVREEVLTFLINRMPRSFEAAKRLAERIDLLALEEKKAVSLAHARQAIADEEDESI